MKKSIFLISSILTLVGCSSESEQWCKEQNGKYENNACTMPISAAECQAEGGRLADPYSCVLPMSKERCDELGGALDNEQQCIIK